jgi:NAD(P)-dependent dehydrogenase (short-subunit alcohol dehydrogenase family)
MEQFKNKVAVITGGGSGIGRALCQELAKQGSIVFVADIHEANAKQVASAIMQGGGKAHLMRVDVSKESEVKNLIDEAVSKYGRLDYLFNNAGVAVGGDARDITLEQWRKVLDVNLNGVLYGSILGYQVMAKQGFGHIVNTASAAGFLPQPGNAPYGTSKHAVIGLSLSLRCEGADLGVKVSAICPGYIRTNLLDAATLVNVSRECMNDIVANAMDISQAVPIILDGVSKNKAMIIFPMPIRVARHLDRLFPRLTEQLWIKGMRDFREFRQDPSSGAS